MRKPISLTVIIPAFNEEGNIEEAILDLNKHLQPARCDYELLVINDGSTDKTSIVVKKMMQNNNRIRFIDRKHNIGFADTFKEGISHAQNKYITQFHADNDASAEYISKFINLCRQFDIVTNYPVDQGQRSLMRSMISKSFVLFLNSLFGLHLRYFNGTFIAKRQILEKIPLYSKGFAIYAEAKVRLLKRGYSIKEVPFTFIGRRSGVSKAVTYKSVLETVQTVVFLVRDIYFRGHG